MESKRRHVPVKAVSFQWFMQVADLDKAVVFAFLLRTWQTVAGAVSLLMIARFFSAELQGYYYTFSSLLGLQAFVELGLYVVILSLASHEWSKLSLDGSRGVVGDAKSLSRLASLMHFISKWYTAVSFVFVLGVGMAGHVFLAMSHAIEVTWRAPWWTVVALAAVQLWLMPILTLLEGCNQVVELNRFRLAQTVAEALTLWLLLATGAGLWAAAGALGVKVVATVLFLVVRYGHFFRSLLAGTGQACIQWKEDVWPMQWRLAAQGVVNYFVYSLFTPIMFHYHGPTVAGQMGMTLQVISVVQMMSIVWVQTKVPLFGMLAARKDFVELDRIWWRASKISFGFIIVGSLGMWMAVMILGVVDANLASRVLGPLPVSLFLIANALLQIPGYQVAYLRAHAKEPFVILGVLGGLLNCGLVFLLGSRYGATGAAAGFLATVGIFLVPMGTLIWKRRRAEWQSG